MPTFFSDSNLATSAATLANKKAEEAKANAAAQAKAASSHFSDPLIAAQQKVANLSADKLAAQAASGIQSQVDRVKSQAAETTCKKAAQLESQLKDNVKEITLFPEKIPMNLTESLSTKVGKVAGLNQSEMTIEVQGAVFAKTAFLGRSIDAIGVEDTYGIKDSKVKNKSSDSDMTVAAVAIRKLIMGEGDLKKDLPSIVKKDSGSFSLSLNGLADRIKNVLGGSSAAMNQIGGALMGKTFDGSLDGAAKALMTQFDAKLNGVLSQFTATDTTTAQALFDGINRLTKNSNFAQLFDVGVESQLLTGLLQEAVALKMPDAVTALTGAANSPVAATQALRNVLGGALSSGDASTVLQFVNQLGSNQVLSLDPTAVSKILSNYKIPPYTPQLGLIVQANYLINLLNATDPNWATMDRNGETVSNLFALNGMSDDARRVLGTMPEYRDLMEVATYYSNEPFAKSMTDKYPMCPILA